MPQVIYKQCCLLHPIFAKYSALATTRILVYSKIQCTVYLHACQMRVTVGDSDLCCCACVMSFER